MQRATLYLLVGYPGAGKTTTAQSIERLTGAVHIWTDHERHQMFSTPTHTEAESQQLYDYLNTKTGQLLSQGKSVIFDTSFNFRKDRDYLRSLATAHGAQTQIIRLVTPKEVARDRALHADHAEHNHYKEVMSAASFERIAGHLEEPNTDEHPIVLDGTLITDEYVADKLGLQI